MSCATPSLTSSTAFHAHKIRAICCHTAAVPGKKSSETVLLWTPGKNKEIQEQEQVIQKSNSYLPAKEIDNFIFQTSTKTKMPVLAVLCQQTCWRLETEPAHSSFTWSLQRWWASPGKDVTALPFTGVLPVLYREKFSPWDSICQDSIFCNIQTS